MKKFHVSKEEAKEYVSEAADYDINNQSDLLFVVAEIRKKEKWAEKHAAIKEMERKEME
jgi:hypothetical protein